jgi:hypothetical protein
MLYALPTMISAQFSALSSQLRTCLPSTLISFLIFFFFSLSLPGLASAATPSPAQNDPAKEYRQQGQLERIFIVQAFLKGVASDITCQLIGVKRTNAFQDCLVHNKATNGLRPLTQREVLARNYERGGLVVMSGDAIGFLFTKPADGGSYLRHMVQDFGITKKAYAQVDCIEDPNNIQCTSGAGFQSLSQIQNLFELSRNIVFMLLVIIFVIVGVLIMIRFHLDPRTVMTVQNQIPKAVIAIILISFSYAIAGLLVDAMWVTTYIGINAVAGTRSSCNPDGGTINPDEEMPLAAAATSGIINNPIGFTTDIFGDQTGCFNSFDGISGLALTVGSSFADLVSRAVLGAVGLDEDFGGDCNIGNFGACVQLAIFTIIKLIATIVAFLVILIALLASLFRLWFMLLKNYIMLLIDIILGPFIIMLGLIPASSYGFTKWIRSIIAQLAVFPAAALLLVMASVIASDPSMNDPGSGVFIPPLIGNPNIADNMGAIIAFGFILIAPGLLDTLREALQAPASKQSGLVTAGIAAATGRVMGAGKGTGERIGGRNEAITEADGAGGATYKKRGYFKVPFTGMRVGG